MNVEKAVCLGIITLKLTTGRNQPSMHHDECQQNSKQKSPKWRKENTGCIFAALLLIALFYQVRNACRPCLFAGTIMICVASNVTKFLTIPEIVILHPFALYDMEKVCHLITSTKGIPYTTN